MGAVSCPGCSLGAVVVSLIDADRNGPDMEGVTGAEWRESGERYASFVEIAPEDFTT